MAKFLISCPDPLIALVDEFIDQARNATGLKLTRSKMIQILLGVMVKTAERVDFANVYDDETLRTAVLNAIRAKG